MSSLLHYSETGQGDPLVLLHGLFGSSKNWQSHARALGQRFHVYSVDLRNHGESFHADEMNYAAMAEDLDQLLSTIGLETCHLLGHSMGGKVAMTLAMRQPERISSLLVADIAPVAYFHHYDDLIEPILALSLDELGSRADADQALRQNIPEDQLRAFLLQNLQRGSEGWRWRVNWLVIQRDMEWLTGFDAPAQWQISTPTLFLRGANSDYIGTVEIEEIGRHFSDYDLVTIAEAGHWLHAEQPRQFIDAVLGFLPGT